MLSLRSFIPFLFLFSSLGLSDLFGRQVQPFLQHNCPNPATTCKANSGNTNDTCCYSSNAGIYILQQIWDYNISSKNQWYINGFATADCTGQSVTNCDPTRDYQNISAILLNYNQKATLKRMQLDWTKDTPQEALWNQNWDQYGTCISSLDPKCYNTYETGQEVAPYFSYSIKLWRNTTTYQWLYAADIKPSQAATYYLADIQNALKARFGATPYVGCTGNLLTSVGFYYNLQSQFQYGKFIPTPAIGYARGACPVKGIRYLPKPTSN